ncbi:DJ-1/PfpI family protein [Desulfovibrio sp. UCD-KL4C]|uniref:DJ-1/PfpI family protein n=1 Tax=Desulfovibrio sp. UCD-KL4C TaxID=2578120 RepID=UPI0025C12860|nr:DJ-1/PfpI family protein [Desulfovibrio sp. UCD-KL4C]
MTTYGIYIYDQVAELDFVGPLQVFATSNSILDKSDKIITISNSTEPIRGIGGLQVIPDFSFENAPVLDVLLIPGTAEATEHALNNPEAVEWISKQANKVKWMTGVCTGSLIMQKAGLLKGRKATTHWLLMEYLEKDPEVTALPEMRYVRDGNVVTAQGISAGIDMALWLVGQIYTPEHARMVRKILQYDPAPPYTAEV